MTSISYPKDESFTDQYVTQSTSFSATSFSDGSDFLMNRRTSSSELIDTDPVSLSSRESFVSLEVYKEDYSLYQLALEYCDEKNSRADLQKGISLLKQSACQGESNASMKLGQIYQDMDGADRSYIYALFWFQHAMRINPELKDDCRDVCTKIRRQVADKMCSGVDSYKAYLSLAKQKIPIGQYLVGLSYEMGLFDGAQVNAKKAFSWYKKVGRRLKDADIFFDLGMRYLKEEGGQKSDRKAISCLQEAEMLKHESARIELGLLYYQKRKFTRTIGYLGTELDKEDPRVSFTLAEMYFHGFYFDKNHNKAMVYYESAAHSGHLEAQVILGRIYAGEFGGNENLEEAFYWFKEAAAQSHVLAQYKLAVLYYNGQGVKQSFTKAFTILSILAKQIATLEQEDLSVIDFDIKSNVEYMLARMYFEGKGAKQNQDKGAKLLAQASAKGNLSAQSYARKKGIA